MRKVQFQGGPLYFSVGEAKTWIGLEHCMPEIRGAWRTILPLNIMKYFSRLFQELGVFEQIMRVVSEWNERA
jgi:hypothetical protein